MADIREILGNNLRRLRAERGWTQEELADRTQLTARYIGKTEHAQAAATVDVLEKLAGAFGVLADLLKE